MQTRMDLVQFAANLSNNRGGITFGAHKKIETGKGNQFGVNIENGQAITGFQSFEISAAGYANHRHKVTAKSVEATMPIPRHFVIEHTAIRQVATTKFRIHNITGSLNLLPNGWVHVARSKVATFRNRNSHGREKLSTDVPD